MAQGLKAGFFNQKEKTSIDNTGTSKKTSSGISPTPSVPVNSSGAASGAGSNSILTLLGLCYKYILPIMGIDCLQAACRNDETFCNKLVNKVCRKDKTVQSTETVEEDILPIEVLRGEANADRSETANIVSVPTDPPKAPPA